MEETYCTGERLLTSYFDRSTIEHLHRYGLACRLAADKDVLDIASGEGYGSNILATVAGSVVGVDIDASAVEHAAKKYVKPNLRYLAGSTDVIPLEAASVDLVVSFETLEHHDRHEEMYAEIKRVLRPGGVLIVSTPDRRFSADLPGHDNPYHVKELYYEEFMDLNRRYFSNVIPYRQRVVYGSLILQPGNEDGFAFLQGDHSQVVSASDFAEPTYHVCVASDGDIVPFGPSFFDGDAVLQNMEAAIGEQWRWQIDHLTARAEAHAREIENLTKSLSFRLGSALLAPLKFLTGRKS